MICYSHDSHIHVPWSLVMMYKLIILYFLQSQLFCTLFRITYKIKTEIGVFLFVFQKKYKFLVYLNRASSFALLGQYGWCVLCSFGDDFFPPQQHQQDREFTRYSCFSHSRPVFYNR